LNSDIYEIDHTDLENILLSSDDEGDAHGVVEQDFKSHTDDDLIGLSEGPSSDDLEPEPVSPPSLMVPIF
jgi:hypothetical protein